MTQHTTLILRLCALTLSFTAANLALADELDLRISNSSLGINYDVESETSDVRWGGGWFYVDDNDDANLFNLNLHTKGQTAIANLPTTLLLGIQGNIIDEDNLDAYAIGVGGAIRSNLPDVPGLSAEIDLHYAPSILAFQDADEFRRLRLQLNYRVIKSADITAGYRHISVGLDNTGGRTTIESGAYLGLRMQF